MTKVILSLLSVTNITEERELRVVCDQATVVIIDAQDNVLATFPTDTGLYVCTMKLRNPKCTKELFLFGSSLSQPPSERTTPTNNST